MGFYELLDKLLEAWSLKKTHFIADANYDDDEARIPVMVCGINIVTNNALIVHMGDSIANPNAVCNLEYKLLDNPRMDGGSNVQA